MAELVGTKLDRLFDSPLEIAIPELITAVVAAHAINPRHQILSEEIPRSERSPQMHQADERITSLIRAYLEIGRAHV